MSYDFLQTMDQSALLTFFAQKVQSDSSSILRMYSDLIQYRPSSPGDQFFIYQIQNPPPDGVNVGGGWRGKIPDA